MVEAFVQTTKENVGALWKVILTQSGYLLVSRQGPLERAGWEECNLSSCAGALNPSRHIGAAAALSQGKGEASPSP